jgi:hypothetical protein
LEEQIERATSSGREAARRRPLRPNVLFPYVGAGQSRKGTYRGRLLERGLYRLGPLRASTRFPFGLFSRTVTVGGNETLIILPRLGRLTSRWAARRHRAFTGIDPRRRQAGGDGNFFGIREWHSGDGRRLVHWRSSARLGKLVVRQFERPRSRDVAVVLDLWQPEPCTRDQHDTAELAVSFAGTVLDDLCRKAGSNIYLSLDDAGQCCGGPASPSLLQRFMDQLALARACNGDTLPAMLAGTLQHVEEGTEIVLISTRRIDLTDRQRFAGLWSDRFLRESVRHILCIDASSEQLADYFVAE